MDFCEDAGWIFVRTRVARAGDFGAFVGMLLVGTARPSLAIVGPAVPIEYKCVVLVFWWTVRQGWAREVLGECVPW